MATFLREEGKMEKEAKCGPTTDHRLPTTNQTIIRPTDTFFLKKAFTFSRLSFANKA